MEPVSAINPFTRQPITVSRPYSFHVQADGVPVGNLMWEESEVIVVSGSHAAVDKAVADACAALEAEFEEYQEEPTQA